MIVLLIYLVGAIAAYFLIGWVNYKNFTYEQTLPFLCMFSWATVIILLFVLLPEPATFFDKKAAKKALKDQVIKDAREWMCEETDSKRGKNLDPHVKHTDDPNAFKPTQSHWENHKHNKM